MKRGTRVAALTAVVLAAMAGLGGGAFIYSGWYDVSATTPHTAVVHHVMDVALARAVQVRSADVQVPDLDGEGRVRNGSRIYRMHCAQCHGAPGVAPQPFALGLNPAPAALVATARGRPAADVFWITREGIKMTGMPAWRYRLSDPEIWDVVAFLRRLPMLTPAGYRDMDDGQPPEAPDRALADRPRVGDAELGRHVLQQYLCVTCHAIPGVPGAWTSVGPSLAGLADRPYIAGVMTNTPENLQRWLREPTAIKPGSLMPDLGVTEADARDMAAFLHTLSEAKP